MVSITQPNAPGFANPSSPGVLTVLEVARELRCSKAHVHHLISGRVPGVRPLPSLWLGRRRLILRASLEEWVRANEKAPASVL
jgi:excisionase family DNA binding protein